jgi:DNA-directed RNA polymerase specialized sigma24 family protein
LRSLERLSFKEVAAAMDRSHDSVTKLWYRAIMKLQQELEGYDDSQEIKK